MPHHEVISPYKSITKLRVVQDASAQLKRTRSLNGALYSGTIMLPDLLAIGTASLPQEGEKKSIIYLVTKENRKIIGLREFFLELYRHHFYYRLHSSTV